ncbi:Asp [Human immunodeficiency virus 1]|uniref:Asp n=1 Tax=Human immunodeficiency virus type 1 TaxID=11676 RepID=UPI000462417F|nr:Asp [Human immunodeficiency virus 1]
MPQTVSCNRCCCASIALSKLFCCCTIPDNNCLACTVSVIEAAPIVLPAAPKNPRNKAPIPTALFSLCTTLLFALVGATPNGSIFTTLYLYNSLLQLSLISPPPGLKISDSLLLLPPSLVNSSPVIFDEHLICPLMGGAYIAFPTFCHMFIICFILHGRVIVSLPSVLFDPSVLQVLLNQVLLNSCVELQ